MVIFHEFCKADMTIPHFEIRGDNSENNLPSIWYSKKTNITNCWTGMMISVRQHFASIMIYWIISTLYTLFFEGSLQGYPGRLNVKKIDGRRPRKKASDPIRQ